MDQRLGCLHQLPRVHLCHSPTPLEAMPNLSARFHEVELFVKRDDCTGLAFGGNKVRQLEFYLGEARSVEADTILITGAVQSNFVRLAAAAARKLGMDCHIQLEERVPRKDSVYRTSGNVLLDRILGATIHSYSKGEDEQGADWRLNEIADELRSRGRRPYIIPLAPGHKPLGALGYVVAAQEILRQLEELDLSLDEIVVPSGSGHTHAGLLFGLRALGSKVRVSGVCVRRSAAAQKQRIKSRVDEIAELLGVTSAVADDDLHLTGKFLEPGYGRMNKAATRAIELAARTEGLILDPVYSCRTMAGFVDRAADVAAGSSLLFIHTGGTPAVFAYGADLVGAQP